MYTLKCEYTPRMESGENGAYKENPWLVITDKQDETGWGGNWSFATFDYEIGAEFINGTLSEKLSAVHSFKLKIYYDSIPDSDRTEIPYNQNYFPQTPIAIDRDFHWNNIDAYRTSCSLYRGDKLIFEGRFTSVEEYMDADGKIYKVVTCESQLAYLSDVVVDANEIRRWFDELKYTKYTPQNLAYAIVKTYNQTTGGYAGHMNKTFGYDNNGTWVMNSNHVNVSNFGSDDYEYILDSNSPDTPLNWLKKIFVDELGGYMWISHNSGKTKTDAGYLRLNIAQIYPTEKSNQKITLGSNMKSLVIRNAYNESGNITQYVPYGGVGADGKRLMLDHVTQRVYGGTGDIVMRSVQNGALANTYGTIEEPLIYDDLVDDGQKTKDELISMENAMLKRAQVQAKQLDDRITSIEVSAYDLYYAGYNVSEFEVGATYYIENSLLNFSGYFQLLEREIDLASPWGGRLTFGSGLRKMSGQTASRFSTIDKRIHNVERTLSTRLDGGSLKLNGKSGALTQAEFDTLLTQHKAAPDKLLIRDDVIYLADQGDTIQAYKGTKPFAGSGGGGDGLYIEHASLVEGSWTANNELITIAQTAGIPAYYGGNASRLIIQGNVACFCKEYDENSDNPITLDDCSSDFKFYNGTTGTDGTATAYAKVYCYVSSLTQTSVTVRGQVNTYKLADDTAVTSGGSAFRNSTYSTSFSATFNITPEEYKNFTCGLCIDVTEIQKVDSTNYYGYTNGTMYVVYDGKEEEYAAAVAAGKSTSSYRYNFSRCPIVAFINGKLRRPASVSNGFGNATFGITYLNIYDNNELMFDLGLTERFEPEPLS